MRIWRQLFAGVLLSGLLSDLAACASYRPGAGPLTMLPRLADDTALLTADGTRLSFKRWDAKGKPHAVLIMLHGFNEYRAAFDAPAPFFADHGIVVYAYDQRGFGETASRGFWAGTDVLGADLTAMVRLVAARHPDLVAAGNIGCITQLSGGGLPVVHTVELLDWMAGGPQPAGVVSPPTAERQP